MAGLLFRVFAQGLRNRVLVSMQRTLSLSKDEEKFVAQITCFHFHKYVRGMSVCVCIYIINYANLSLISTNSS